MWSPSEKKFLKSLKNPEIIQRHLDQMTYNTVNAAISPRYSMLTNDGHCLEGGLLAACALELQGHKPMMVDMVAEKDDHHVITVYKGKHGWGSISKSSTTLLRSREPIYKNVHELVMSYFEFYFNTKGEKSLYSYSNPIDLNRYNRWEWRTTDNDLDPMGQSFCYEPHVEIMSIRELRKLPKVSKDVFDACYLRSNPDGLYYN